MIKLAVFDLDGTLAPVGKPIAEDDILLLKKLENSGVQIAISSGKTLYYLIGFFRQVGLKNPIFIGENGNVTAYGIDLPPKTLSSVMPCKNYFEAKEKILRETMQLFEGKFWLQPNEVMLTLFFKDEETRDRLRKYFSDFNCEDIIVYEHIDSFDVSPVGIDKKSSLEALAKVLDINREHMLAVGDGANDIPMFEYCKYSIGIGSLEKKLTTWHFDNINSALQFLLRYIDDKKI